MRVLISYLPDPFRPPIYKAIEVWYRCLSFNSGEVPRATMALREGLTQARAHTFVLHLGQISYPSQVSAEQGVLESVSGELDPPDEGRRGLVFMKS